MGYFKELYTDIMLAIEVVTSQGFNTDKEMHRAFEAIANQYDVTVPEVWSVFHTMEEENA